MKSSIQLFRILNGMFLTFLALACGACASSRQPTPAKTIAGPSVRSSFITTSNETESATDNSGLIATIGVAEASATPRPSPPPVIQKVDPAAARLGRLVQGAHLIECRPEKGAVRAVPEDSALITGSTPGPFQDAAIATRAKTRLSSSDELKGRFEVRSDEGVITLRTKSVNVEQSAAAINALLAIEGVREIRIASNSAITL